MRKSKPRVEDLASPSWDELYELAGSQHGCFTTRQARGVGFSDQLLQRHLKSGNIERLYRGIYRLTRFPAEGREQEDLVVAWLWSRSAGVFSHETALRMLGLSDAMPANIHLTLPRDREARRVEPPPGVRPYFANFEPADWAFVGAVPVMKASRAIVDVALAHGDANVVDTAIRQALQRGLTTIADILPAVEYLAPGDAPSRTRPGSSTASAGSRQVHAAASASLAPRNIAGQVVRGTDLWGRSAELEELWRKAERGSVLLSAPRRYGKTSLMIGMRDAPRAGWDVVYLDVEYVESPDEFASELIARVLAHPTAAALVERVRRAPGGVHRWLAGLAGEAGTAPPDVAETKLRIRQQAPGDWRPAVELVFQYLGDARTLVILDEFPVMVSRMLDRDESEATRFLHWFRALRQHGGRLLLGGSVNIEPLLVELGQSALINDLERVRLLPFPRDKAVEFVRVVLERENQVTAADLPGHIVDTLGSGVPFFLQVFIDELLTEARRREQPPTADLADHVLSETVLGRRGAVRFQHYLERLRQYGPAEAAARQTLHALATQPSLGTAEFERIARDSGADPHRLLTRLESDSYIERDPETVRFADGFVREWWRRNAPMEQ